MNRRRALAKRSVPSPGRENIERARKKFLRHFPGGFHGEKYLDWERGYKWEAHQRFEEELGRKAFAELLAAGEHAEIGRRAARIEGRTNLLFSFEKMALRDALKEPRGARAFAVGLYDYLHVGGEAEAHFSRWTKTIAGLPRRQTRVLTWPLATVFGFLAQPDRHVFLKPNVTREAARKYQLEFEYRSSVDWATYESLLTLAATLRGDLADLEPRDMIDIQSFLWVLGSDEYP